MSEENPTLAPQEYTRDMFRFTDEERTARWHNYQGSGRVVSIADDQGVVRDYHVNPLTEELATFYAFSQQFDELAKFPPYLTETGPNLGDLGVRAGVMGAIRHPGRTCIVYLNEAGVSRFILVPHQEEIAAWNHVLEREWAALERYEVFDVTPAVSQWAARQSG